MTFQYRIALFELTVYTSKHSLLLPSLLEIYRKYLTFLYIISKIGNGLIQKILIIRSCHEISQNVRVVDLKMAAYVKRLGDTLKEKWKKKICCWVTRILNGLNSFQLQK